MHESKEQCICILGHKATKHIFINTYFFYRYSCVNKTAVNVSVA